MKNMFGENNPFFGKKHSEETKRKISLSRKGKCTGRKHSEETKKKISQALKGIERNDSFREMISKTTKEAMNRKDVKEKMKKVYDKIRGNEEFKKKISLRTKEGMNNEEVKKKLRESKLGKPGPMLGKTHSQETRKLISEKCLGNPAWNKDLPPQFQPGWQGGISCEPYCDAWNDLSYKEDIKLRDNYECQNPDCHKTSNRLTIHHIDYNKKNCHPNNLITVCNSCNSRANSKREEWKLFYTIILEVKNGKM